VPGDLSDLTNGRVMAIFGAGRSGSSWLWAIVGSHPEVAHRFEPIHRRAGGDPKIRALRDRLASGSFGPEVLEEIYAAFSPAYPELVRPPFFKKAFRPRMNWGRTGLWPFARRWRGLAGTFRWLYSPRDLAPLLIKEVAFEHLMRNLLERSPIRVVYLIRHPAALLHSLLGGQDQALMPTGRRAILADYVAAEDPDLPARLGVDLKTLTPLEIEAIMLRLDMEVGWRAAQASPRALVVVYEELCERPFEVARRVFDHFGLDFAETSRKFIRMSMGGSRWGRLRALEIGVDQYFSVFRNPRMSRDRWKNEMALADRRRVLELFESSAVFRGVQAGGSWWQPCA